MVGVDLHAAQFAQKVLALLSLDSLVATDAQSSSVHHLVGVLACSGQLASALLVVTVDAHALGVVLSIWVRACNDGLEDVSLATRLGLRCDFVNLAMVLPDFQCHVHHLLATQPIRAKVELHLLVKFLDVKVDSALVWVHLESVDPGHDHWSKIIRLDARRHVQTK